jgi:uncharacterized membrane protein YhaH (DUF805 family)
MNFTDAVKTCFNKYADFKGRASRSEFWWFQLFYILAALIGMMINPVLGGIAYLAMLLPLLSVSIRRLHDKNKSGWFYLLVFVPLAGILLLVWFCQRGTVGDNVFGPEPADVAGTPV